MRSPTELTEAFRSRGLKITPHRQAIFRILHENEEHPTAEAVYATVVTEMPSISLRTVYQTLNDLAEMGELRALDVGTGSVRFDPNVDEHHHVAAKRVLHVPGRITHAWLQIKPRFPKESTQNPGVDISTAIIADVDDEPLPVKNRIEFPSLL